MEMEQFKMVIELLQNVQEGAMLGICLFLAWLVLKLILTWVGALLLVHMLIRGGFKLARTCTRGGIDEATLLYFAEKLGTKTPGEFVQREKEETKRKLNEIVDEYIAKGILSRE